MARDRRFRFPRSNKSLMRTIPAGADSLPRSIYILESSEMYGIKQRLPSDARKREGKWRGGGERKGERRCRAFA